MGMSAVVEVTNHFFPPSPLSVHTSTYHIAKQNENET